MPVFEVDEETAVGLLKLDDRPDVAGLDLFNDHSAFYLNLLSLRSLVGAARREDIASVAVRHDAHDNREPAPSVALSCVVLLAEPTSAEPAGFV